MSEMIILRERVITIKAGDTFDQSLQGNVLRLTAGAVPLRVQDREQQMDFTLLAGERAAFEGEFPGVILSHASGVDQTFTIQVGKGVNVASALVSGTVSISGTANVSIVGTPTVVNGGGTLTSIANTVKTLEDALQYGASFRSNTALVANAADTVFTPEANINGAIVHMVTANHISNVWGFGLLTRPTSAPTTVLDGNVLALGDAKYATSAVMTIKIDRDIWVPAGRGLYFIGTGNGTYSDRSVLYTLK